MQKIKNSIIMRSLFWFILINMCATIIGYFFNYIDFPETNIVIIYILAVMLIARFTDGYYWGILASIISTFSFNYFFTVPYFTFSVNDPDYIITFAIMTITSVITSALTSKIRGEAVIYPMGDSLIQKNDKVLVITNKLILSTLITELFGGTRNGTWKN